MTRRADDALILPSHELEWSVRNGSNADLGHLSYGRNKRWRALASRHTLKSRSLTLSRASPGGIGVRILPQDAGLDPEESAAAVNSQNGSGVRGEELFQFLDRLGQEVSKATDADEIMAVTTKLTAEHLALSNCAYADMDEDEDGFTIRGNWHAPGSPSIVGHYSLADFGSLAVKELKACRPLIINDNSKEIEPHEARAFQDIGIAATICMPRRRSPGTKLRAACN